MTFFICCRKVPQCLPQGTLHGPLTVLGAAMVDEFLPLMGVKLVVVAQEAARWHILDAHDGDVHASHEIDGDKLAVWVTGVVDEMGHVRNLPGVDVPPPLGIHHVKAGVVVVIVGLLLEVLLLCLLVNDPSHLLLNQVALLDPVGSDEAPAFAMLTSGPEMR